VLALQRLNHVLCFTAKEITSKRFTLICTKLQQMQIGYSNLRRTTKLRLSIQEIQISLQQGKEAGLM
jgi:hypothetical protein